MDEAKSIHQTCKECGYDVSALNLRCPNCGEFLQGNLSTEFQFTENQPSSYQNYVLAILDQTGMLAGQNPAQTMVVHPVQLSQLDMIPEWKLAGCDCKSLLECARVLADSDNRSELARKLCDAATLSFRISPQEGQKQLKSDLINVMSKIYQADELKTKIRLLQVKHGLLSGAQITAALLPAFLASANPAAISDITLSGGFVWFCAWYAFALRE